MIDKTRLPDILTIEVDSREKYPVPFPASIKVEDSYPGILHTIQVQTVRTALPCGDYRLAEFSDLCIIERKASQSELLKNLIDPRDSIRQCSSFQRLSESCRTPILLLECTPTDLMTPLPGNQPAMTDMLLSRLTILLSHYRMGLLLAGHCSSINSRRNLGTLILHTLAGYAICGCGSRSERGSVVRPPLCLDPLLETIDV